MNSFKSQDGEDDSTGVNGSKRVADGENDHVFDTILLWVVVRSEADNGPKSQTEGVENLICCI